MHACNRSTHLQPSDIRMRMENKHKLAAAMHRQPQPATNNKMGGPLKANKPRKMVHSFSQIIEPKKSEGIICFVTSACVQSLPLQPLKKQEMSINISAP